MKKHDVCALGELLIDFTDNGISQNGNPVMEANPGGAPCNVLSMLTRLGHSTVFIGKVGEDMFGRQLRRAITDVGIDDSGLLSDPAAHTTLAFVHTSDGGEREFSFYRDPGADMLLTEDEVDTALIESSRIFHFGSLSMTSKACEKATLKAINIAKCAGIPISFDPNLRESLWSDLDTAKEKIKLGLSLCDILKISDNEILWVTDEDDYDRAVEKLRAEYDIKYLFLSLGDNGSRAYTPNAYASAEIYDVDTIEKTGAGDAFCGCVLAKLLERELAEPTAEELEDILHFANAGAGLVTTQKGALRVMPTADEIEALIMRGTKK